MAAESEDDVECEEDFDNGQEPGPPRRRGWLEGRAGRKEYWTYVGLVIALDVGLNFIPGFKQASSGLIIALALEQVRRLHDFDRSGWWALAATAAPGVVMLPLSAFSLSAAMAVGILTQLMLVIWIGVVKGDPDENRFGPPPPFTFRRVMPGR